MTTEGVSSFARKIKSGSVSPCSEEFIHKLSDFASKIDPEELALILLAKNAACEMAKTTGLSGWVIIGKFLAELEASIPEVNLNPKKRVVLKHPGKIIRSQKK